METPPSSSASGEADALASAEEFVSDRAIGSTSSPAVPPPASPSAVPPGPSLPLTFQQVLERDKEPPIGDFNSEDMASLSEFSDSPSPPPASDSAPSASNEQSASDAPPSRLDSDVASSLDLSHQGLPHLENQKFWLELLKKKQAVPPPPPTSLLLPTSTSADSGAPRNLQSAFEATLPMRAEGEEEAAAGRGGGKRKGSSAQSPRKKTLGAAKPSPKKQEAAEEEEEEEESEKEKSEAEKPEAATEEAKKAEEDKEEDAEEEEAKKKAEKKAKKEAEKDKQESAEKPGDKRPLSPSSEGGMKKKMKTNEEEDEEEEAEGGGFTLTEEEVTALQGKALENALQPSPTPEPPSARDSLNGLRQIHSPPSLSHNEKLAQGRLSRLVAELTEPQKEAYEVFTTDVTSTEAAVLSHLKAQLRIVGNLLPAHIHDPDQYAGHLVYDRDGEELPLYQTLPHLVFHLTRSNPKDPQSPLVAFPHWRWPTNPDGTCIPQSLLLASQPDRLVTIPHRARDCRPVAIGDMETAARSVRQSLLQESMKLLDRDEDGKLLEKNLPKMSELFGVFNLPLDREEDLKERLKELGPTVEGPMTQEMGSVFALIHGKWVQELRFTNPHDLDSAFHLRNDYDSPWGLLIGKSSHLWRPFKEKNVKKEERIRFFPYDTHAYDRLSYLMYIRQAGNGKLTGHCEPLIPAPNYFYNTLNHPLYPSSFSTLLPMMYYDNPRFFFTPYLLLHRRQSVSEESTNWETVPVRSGFMITDSSKEDKVWLVVCTWLKLSSSGTDNIKAMLKDQDQLNLFEQLKSNSELKLLPVMGVTTVELDAIEGGDWGVQERAYRKKLKKLKESPPIQHFSSHQLLHPNITVWNSEPEEFVEDMFFQEFAPRRAAPKKPSAGAEEGEEFEGIRIQKVKDLPLPFEFPECVLKAVVTALLAMGLQQDLTAEDKKTKQDDAVPFNVAARFQRFVNNLNNYSRLPFGNSTTLKQLQELWGTPAGWHHWHRDLFRFFPQSVLLGTEKLIASSSSEEGGELEEGTPRNSRKRKSVGEGSATRIQPKRAAATKPLPLEDEDEEEDKEGDREGEDFVEGKSLKSKRGGASSSSSKQGKKLHPPLLSKFDGSEPYEDVGPQRGKELAAFLNQVKDSKMIGEKVDCRTERFKAIFSDKAIEKHSGLRALIAWVVKLSSKPKLAEGGLSHISTRASKVALFLATYDPQLWAVVWLFNTAEATQRLRFGLKTRANKRMRETYPLNLLPGPFNNEDYLSTSKAEASKVESYLLSPHSSHPAWNKPDELSPHDLALAEQTPEPPRLPSLLLSSSLPTTPSWLSQSAFSTPKTGQGKRKGGSEETEDLKSTGRRVNTFGIDEEKPGHKHSVRGSRAQAEEEIEVEEAKAKAKAQAQAAAEAAAVAVANERQRRGEADVALPTALSEELRPLVAVLSKYSEEGIDAGELDYYISKMKEQQRQQRRRNQQAEQQEQQKE